MVNEFNGSTWAGWKTLVSSVTSDPSCTSNGDGKIICAAVATGGGLQVTIFSGTAWSDPTTVAGTLLFSAPSCAEYISPDVICVARNAAGGLSWAEYNGTSWGAFAAVPGTNVTDSNPSCTSDHADGVVCGVFTTAYNTLVNRFADGKWEGYLNIGGTAGGNPDCVYFQHETGSTLGPVECFVKGYQSQVYGSNYDGKSTWAATDWTGYGTGIGGELNDNASCVSHELGEFVCGVVGASDNEFFSNVYNGTSWSGWTLHGGSGMGTPSCALLTTDKVVCLILSTKNTLSSVVGP
jgi:hypothetical protein